MALKDRLPLDYRAHPSLRVTELRRLEDGFYLYCNLLNLKERVPCGEEVSLAQPGEVEGHFTSCKLI